MIEVNYQDPRAIYEQIVDKYEMLIVSGALKKDEKLPSVRSIATRLSINPNTVQKAFSILESNGYIYTVKGRGSFVTEPDNLRKERIRKWRYSLSALVQEGIQLGLSKGDCINTIEQFYEREDRKND